MFVTLQHQMFAIPKLPRLSFPHEISVLGLYLGNPIPEIQHCSPKHIIRRLVFTNTAIIIQCIASVAFPAGQAGVVVPRPAEGRGSRGAQRFHRRDEGEHDQAYPR